MSSFIFDPAYFRSLYTEFSANPPNTDILLQSYWDFATDYISDTNCGILNCDQRKRSLYLMTAHIAKYYKTMGSANTKIPQIVTSAAVDKVSASFATPPFGTSEFIQWLYTTPYGAMLAALLRTVAAGGFQIGGTPEIPSFRKAGGSFGGPIIPPFC